MFEVTPKTVATADDLELTSHDLFGDITLGAFIV